ncbi:hypothetical protein PC112_g13587 [Phytophthora cactorum]|nr:hypothetical protein PC112_g13587 [Phytophthora cactorum]
MAKPLPFGSVLEASSVLNELLRPSGYRRDRIDELAVWDFLDYELANLREPTNIHLLAVKKALLYATPVIAPPKQHLDIALTSAVATSAEWFDDAGRIGTYSYKLPAGYAPATIDVSRIPGVTAHRGGSCHLGHIYLTGHSYYEKVGLFVAIDRAIANNMYPAILPPQIGPGFARGVARCPPPTWVRLQRMSPLAKLEYLATLNAVLTREVDGTFACALYETLQNTSSWNLYDQIRLYGFESAQIGEQLRLLAYVKEQTLKVRQNTRAAVREQHMAARAEKIARIHFPYYFDYTDHGGLFVRFNRFALDKVPQPDRGKIQILLDKSIAAQDALLNRRCDHLPYLRAFIPNRYSAQAFTKLAPFVGDMVVEEAGMYACRMCAQPLICEHEFELRKLLEVAERLTNAASRRGEDGVYWAQRKIVNMYALINHQQQQNDDGGGDKTTESLYTHYCKYCGGELGKSADAVQAGRITWASGTAREINSDERMLFTFVSSNVRACAPNDDPHEPVIHVGAALRRGQAGSVRASAS